MAVYICLAWFAVIAAVSAEKYRFCVVNGKGNLNKGERYCPALDSTGSKVECVIALDRLDCLRRIHKGKADFAVFTPEDLVTATNAGVEILVTNQLKYSKEKYEYQIVAVLDNTAGIKSKHDLKGKKYCHPGYGYEADYTRILANYFEASVITPQCNTQMTMTENRIKAASDFFKSACKAGPWVDNFMLDMQLKTKYSNLCQLCGNPGQCATRDRYWGRRGAIFCLTDGAGDVAWARLDDVKQHFGLSPGGAEAEPTGYSLLCPDDTILPLNTTEPCVWAVKPWAVVASRRTVAEEIQELVSSLTHQDRTSWHSNLLNLIESAYLTVQKFQKVEAVETYLQEAPGFLSANSFSSCHPPRTIRICTTSILENAKCSWLRESAAVYGIEPDLDCLKADNSTHCMMALNSSAADVVMVQPDLVNLAKTKYNLKTLFYETVPDRDKHIVVAVTLKNSPITSFEDVRGAKACFPSYDGIAWNSLLSTLTKMKLIASCEEAEEFFGASCVPGASNEDLTSICESDFVGEKGAMQCLSSGKGDIAFVSKSALDDYVKEMAQIELDSFKILCPSKPCHLSWSPLGYGMVRSNSSELWLKDTLNVFQNLDNLFGKNYRSLTEPFTLFGRYDGKSDMLFHDATMKLRNVPTMKNTDNMPNSYDEILKEGICLKLSSRGGRLESSLVVVFVLVFLNCFNLY